MIDTPQNCFRQAASSRSAAQGPMLDNVRQKHLAAAAAWESLGTVLLGRARNRDASPSAMLAEAS